MAVLKRFSYDNIVEHNPTAPDPVDYDGGGEGGWKYYVVLDEEAGWLYLKDSAGNDVSYDQFLDDIGTMAFFDGTYDSELGEPILSYSFLYLSEIAGDVKEIVFTWPADSYNTTVHFEDVDGKLQANPPY